MDVQCSFSALGSLSRMVVLASHRAIDSGWNISLILLGREEWIPKELKETAAKRLNATGKGHPALGLELMM